MSILRLSAQAALLLGLASFTTVPAFAQAGQAAKAGQTPKAGDADEKPEVKLPALVVGSKAPALSIEKWIKGQPVPAFEKGKVYMVEFWATWCPPCIASMPHISELQKKFAAQGLTVIGVSALDKRGNTLEKAEKMVADKGDGMGYTVAWDKDRSTNEAYMEAAEQGGIPCSFLVDQNGMIAYIGHPMQIEKTLESVMANKHDIKALAAGYKKDIEIEAQSKPIMGAMDAAGQKKDWDGVLAQMDKLIALDGEKFGGYVAGKFQVTAFQMKDSAKAYTDAKAWYAAAKDPSLDALNAIAWTIVDPESQIDNRDVDFALTLAKRANEIKKNEDPAMLDTLARAWFLKGDLDKAVETETRAVAKSGDNEKLKKDLEKSLEEFKDAQAKKTKG